MHIDDSNFESSVFPGDDIYSVVLFNSPSCVYCREFDPQFKPLGDIYEGTNLHVFEIDALNNKRIRGKYHLASFPVMKVFSGNGTELETYGDDKWTTSMVKHLTELTGVEPNKFPEYVARLDNDTLTNNQINDMIFEDLSKDVFVMFYEPWDEVLGNKYISFFEETARYYAEKTNIEVNFVGIDVSNRRSTEFTSRFQVGKYPTVFYFPGGRTPEESAIAYKCDSDLGAGALVSMLEGEDVGQVKVDLEAMAKELEELYKEDEEEDDDDDADVNNANI